MTFEDKQQLQSAACKIRMGIIKAVYSAQSGHPGGSLSAADLMAFLYFKELQIDPCNPRWEDRDRFVLSKGHASPALYATLALKNFFPEKDLLNFRKSDSYLQGHPNMNTVPGVDMSTGSLGQGISCAVGMALGLKHQNKKARVYTLLGDGEIQEGQVWEACMFASHYKLDNLCVVIDNNSLQIDGRVADVMSPYPITEKFRSFGFHVEAIDGHDFEQIDHAMNIARNIKGQPTAIVMKTVKGKGISYMEDQAGWHGKAPDEEQYAQAMSELKKQLAELEAK